jgi:hypothetical protein
LDYFAGASESQQQGYVYASKAKELTVYIVAPLTPFQMKNLCLLLSYMDIPQVGILKPQKVRKSLLLESITHINVCYILTDYI